MEHNPQNQHDIVVLPSPDFGNVPKYAEVFRMVPNVSEPFGTLRKDAESFRTLPHTAERKENHTLTVRETARMFEAAGVARTERSIINWCQPNRTGVARLDAYYDPNERKYFISPQSIEMAIAEEKAKATKNNDALETPETVPHPAEPVGKSKPSVAGEESRVKELERENLDLKIANRGKDLFIDQLKDERTDFFDQLLTATRKMGELETKLLQIESPAGSIIDVK